MSVKVKSCFISPPPQRTNSNVLLVKQPRTKQVLLLSKLGWPTRNSSSRQHPNFKVIKRLEKASDFGTTHTRGPSEGTLIQGVRDLFLCLHLLLLHWHSILLEVFLRPRRVEDTTKSFQFPFPGLHNHKKKPTGDSTASSFDFLISFLLMHHWCRRWFTLNGNWVFTLLDHSGSSINICKPSSFQNTEQKMTYHWYICESFSEQIILELQITKFLLVRNLFQEKKDYHPPL